MLVERVEGFATDDEWRRAYGEITHFEEQLVAHGILLVKFWIHITKDEQLRRFRDRKRTEHKRWKIDREDWRNRGRWSDYTLAVNEMVARTSTRVAPWTLVEGNDKNFARIKVLKTLADCLERRLKIGGLKIRLYDALGLHVAASLDPLSQSGSRSVARTPRSSLRFSSVSEPPWPSAI